MAMDIVSTQVTNILATLDGKGFQTSQTMEISGGGGSIQPLKELVEAIVKEIYIQLTTKAKANDTGTDGAEAGLWPIL